MTPGSVWFGWSGRLAAEPSLQPSLVEARGVTYATIDLESQAYRGFYVGFANGALWPLLHFRLGLYAVPSRGVRSLSRGQRHFCHGAWRDPAARGTRCGRMTIT